MIWVLYGFLHSALRSAFTETGRLFRGDRWQMAFWQALSGLALLLLFLPLMSWPADQRFYAAAAGVAMILTVGTLIHFGLSAQNMGRVSSIYMALEALAAFALWLVINPVLVHEHLNHPGRSAAIIMAFVLACVGLLRIRAQDKGWSVFSIVIPLALTYAVAGVVTKVVMPETAAFSSALTYALVNFAVMTLVTGQAVLLKKKTSGLFDPAVVKGGIFAGVFSAAGYVAFVASVALAPNPGYTSMLAMLLPVWLLLWHRIRRVEDLADPRIAFVLTAGVVLLVLAAF